MIRKALAWLLTLMMVISILPMSVFATEEATADDSAITIGDNVTIIENEEEAEEPAAEIELNEALKGSGTETDPYLINNFDDLVWFRNDVNAGKTYAGKTVTLTVNLMLTDEWTPIGNGTRSGSSYIGNAFAGTFDGGNHTISGLTAPLFGVVIGTVKDVNIVANINDTTNDSVGAAVAVLVGGTVDDVDVSGTVTAVKAAGGVVGRVLAIGTVTNCDNTADVTSTGSSDAAGGIVGKAYYTSTSGVMYITDCTNEGVINGGYAAGGIVGFSAANVSNCTNRGTVTSTGIEAGGIVGEQTNYGTINGNENSANVTGGIAGGIIGWVRYQTNTTAYPLTETVAITNNTNTGSITSGTGLDELSCAGGIVGNIYNQGTVTGNTNKAGMISAATFAAGIVGALQSTSGNVDIDGATFIVTGNTSTTTAANITANCTALDAYNNVGSDATIEDNTVPSDVTYVAKIGETKYESLEEAFAAAQAGDTIVLLADATPALKRQSAITKASVIDLGGKTLTLTQYDLYFGTTTFEHGTIVIAPNTVKDTGTAVFWMFANQDITFDGVEIVATGFKGNYIIGLEGTNSSASLINNSKITIANTACEDLTAVICDNGNGNIVTINDSTINVANIVGRGYLGGTNGTITVDDSTINLDGVKEGFYLRAGQSLSIAGTSNVTITLNDTNGRYGINVTDKTATYTKAAEATVTASVYTPAPAFVAEVNGVGYTDLQEAIKAAAPAGTVEILSDITVDKWIMISQRLSIGNGQIITLDMDGLTINGNNHTLTVNSIESATNGNRLFHEADNLTIKNLTINYAEGVVGGISLKSGELNNVIINGGVGVFPGEGNITITGCEFNTNGSAIYNETDRDNLVVDDNTFNTAAGQYAIYLRGNTTFTNNTVVSGKVNVVNGSPVVTGNDFGTERFKVYNGATATISNNTINNLVFNDESVQQSTFTGNTLSESAQAALDAVTAPAPVFVAYIGEQGYETFEAALAAAVDDHTITEIKIVCNYEQTSVENTTEYYDITGNLTITADEAVKLTGCGFAVRVMGNGASLTIDDNVTIEGMDVVANGFATTGEGMTIEGTLKALSLKQWTSNGTITVTGSVELGYGDGQFDMAYGNGTVTVIGNGDGTVQFKAGYSGTRGNGNTLNLKNTVFNGGAWFNVNGSNGTFNIDNSTLKVPVGDGAGNMTVTSSGNTFKLTNGAKLEVANLALGAGNELVIDGTSQVVVTNITGAGTITIDAANLTAGAQPIVGNASGFTGTIEVINNDKLEAKIVDGKIVLENKPEPTGSNSPAYTGEVDGYVRVWGEGGGNAKESFVLKLYSSETLMATTKLNNVDGIIDGDVYVTWHFFYPSSNDEYWTTTWEEGHPNAGAQPTKVELYIDDTLVATTAAKMSGPDNLNPVVWAELGGVAHEVIEIYTWEDLKALDARVEGGDMLEGVTVKLMNDINLYEMGTDGEPVTFNPIGDKTAYFKGTFDGQGHTIKNMYQSGWALGHELGTGGTIGLFAYIWNATIKNLTIENAECFIEGGCVAGIAGCAWGNCTFENITIKNSTYATYNNRAAGIIGYTGGEGTMTFKNVTVDEDTVIASLWGSYDSTLGGVVGSTQSPTKFHFEDVTVACKLDCYNDVTASYKWYSYRMCGMLIGRMGTLQEDAPTEVDPRGVVTMENVNITIGEWANQTYIWDDSLSKGCQRVEAGYSYGGVDVSQYPDAEITELGFSTIIGGPQSQSKGYYGSDITKLEALEGFDTSGLTVIDLALAARSAVAQIGNVKYETFEAALNAVKDGETITLLAVEGSESKEIDFNKGIEFTITGNAPKYALPTVTFQNATVNIKNATILIPELDARQNATINVIDSTVYDAGGNSIVKSYYNGAINISGTSVVYTMQVTTMGYITISDSAVLNATWQTNVYGNGMITVEENAQFNTAALQLTGKEYSGRDNTDADRVGKPATIVVDGATFIVGSVKASNDADYSYHSSYGINIGTIDDKAAVLDIKNNATVEFYMANDQTANVGADGTVNVAGSTFEVACRAADGTVTLVNKGVFGVAGESTLIIPTLTDNSVDFLDGSIIKDSTVGGDVFVAGNVTFRGDNTFGMLYDYGTLTDYYGTTANMAWTVEAGSSVTLTNKDRYGLGYGDKVTIYGSLTYALTARDTLTDGDIAVFMHGLVAQESTGWNQNSSMTVKNAYVVIGSNNSFGNKPGNYGGTYTFVFENSVVDASRITFYEALSKTTFTFTGSDVKIGTFMTRDADSVFTLTNTKLLSTTTSNGTDEGNYHAGTLVLNNSSLTYSAPLVMENGTLTLGAGSTLAAPRITGTGKLIIDAAGMTAGVVATINVDDASGFTGALEVINNNALTAEIKNGKIVLVETAKVAEVNGVQYATLQAAINDAQAGDTVTLLINATEEEITVVDGKNFVLDLNTYTLTLPRLMINKGATIEIKNGSIVGNTTGKDAVRSAGNLTLTNVNVTGLRHTVRITEGTAVINGGTYKYGGTTTVYSTYHIINIGDDNTGATVTIKDGTFIAGKGIVYDGSNAVQVQGTSIVTIEGGNFSNSNLKLVDAPSTATLSITGGTFDQDPTAYVADGYAALPNLDGNYVVGTKPTATVNNLGAMTIPADQWKDMSFAQGTEDMPLSFVMQFLADQDAADMATSPFADWYGDFVITISGLENDSISTEGIYLAGHYGSFGWIKVPVEDLLTTLDNNARYPVMLGVGMGQKYDYICSGVEDFKCAMYIPEDILEANPNIQVKLELAIVDNSKGSDAATSALVNNENVYSVNEHIYYAEDFVIEEKFDITSSSIVLGNELAMYFYVPKADLNGTDYVAVITKSYADGREDLVVEIPYSEWEETSNNRMRFKFDGIAAKEMADNICAVIKNATTNEVVTNEYNDSIRGYVERGFASGNAQKSAELATMLVDMLNYGAAAQQMFTYATNDLANKNMDAYQAQYATKNIDLVNSQKKGTGYKSASLTLESDILITMLFYKTDVTQDMTAVVTFTDHYGKAHEIRISGDKFTDRGNVWGIVVDELVVADASQIITCTFEDASGNVVDGVYGEDSIESVCARAVAGGGGTYYEDIMKFAKAAYNYFH